MIAPNTGLDNNARLAAADALTAVFADTYALYFRTHAFHWNVTGPNFHALHAMFEVQYREMWAALDTLAERIRALGAFAPANGEALAGLASIGEVDEARPGPERMIRILLEGHEALIRNTRRALSTVSDANDAASEDLLTQRIDIHEKTAWMLRAHVE